MNHINVIQFDYMSNDGEKLRMLFLSVNNISIVCKVNPSPAEPGFTLPLQTVNN